MNSVSVKDRCQSCGMPLEEGSYGTNSNQSINQEYCKYCFLNGEFTQPDLKVEQMIDESVKHLISELKMPEKEARNLSELFIPALKRWMK